MGTKVHCKSYLPGYYSMRNINEDANSSWPRYYEDRTQNGQFCNGFTPRLLNGYLDYDKEILKQTMLRHEEIFKKQVVELHQLYRRQRDLMEELKRNEEKKILQVKSSQPSPCSLQMLPKGMEKSFQVHGFPSTGASCSRTPISGVDGLKNHLNSLNGSSFQAGLMPRENGTSQDNQLPDPRVMKLPRKMLDLELPADAYIEIEDADHAEEKNVIKPLFGSPDPSKRNYGLQPENDVTLTLGAAQNPCSRDETQKSSSNLQNGLQTCHLADLNEPLEEVSCDEMASSSSKFPVQTNNLQDPKGFQKSVESVSSLRGLQKDLSQDRYNGGDGSISMHMERGEKWRFFNNDIGKSSSHMNSFTSSLSNKNRRPLSEPVPVDPSQAQDFSSMFPPRQGQTASWFTEKQYEGSELSDRCYHTANKVHSGLTVPMMPGSLCVPPLIDYSRTASPGVSPWKKPPNDINPMSTAAQAFRCFGVSAPMSIQGTSLHNIESACEKWQCDRDIRPTPNFGSVSYPNGFGHGLQYKSATAASAHMSPIGFSRANFNNGANASYEESESHGHQMHLNGLHCMDVKTAKGMNLNIAPLNGFRNGCAPKAEVLSNTEGKKDDLSGRIPWLRTKSPCGEPLGTGLQRELASVQGRSLPIPPYCLSEREVEQNLETEASSSLEVMQDLPPVLKPKGTSIKQNETVAASSNSRILGFPLPQGTQHSNISFTTDSQQKISQDDDDEVKNRAKEGLFPIDSSHRTKLLDLEKQVHMDVVSEKGTAETATSCFGGHINLNSSAASIDQLKSSESSSEDEINLPSLLSVRGIATRFAPEIDLEAPPPSLEEEQALLSGTAPQIDQLVQRVEPEGRKADLQTTEVLDEALARIAAEAIQIISLNRTIHLEDAACRPLQTASADTLHWFADWVTSNGENPDNIEAVKFAGVIDSESSDIDDMDYFEYMTLHLAETRIDEYCFRPMEEEHSEEGETGVAHLLLSRPRRGQARRRRQRRDFQRDILPGLASLSRQEVTEDMQIIGGLMKASGQPWKAGGTRRNAARNRPRRPARGGWRARTTAPATASSKEEAAIEGRNILGWGRTTKRCRRQRCPPGIALLPPPS